MTSFHSTPIPSSYHVILPKSNQTVLDAPPRYVRLYTHSLSLANLRLPLTKFFCEVLEYFLVHISRLNPFSIHVFPDPILFLDGLQSSWENGQQRPAILVCGKEMAFRNFVYVEDEKDLSFLPKEPSLAFGTSSLSIIGSVKTRGGSSRPLVKRRLALGSLTSRATRAKTYASKDDISFLSISNEDEGKLPSFEFVSIVFAALGADRLFAFLLCFVGLSNVRELKDATTSHLNISAITPPAWKNHLDNHMDLELLDLHDRYYARQAFIDNAVNRRSRELLEVIEKLRGECDVIKERERA
ncbi:hypothetical protein Tco_0648742 [Tanacetum coccineum]